MATEQERNQRVRTSIFVLVIVSIILFSVSFDTLSPTEIGLDYNKNWYNLDETTVYGPGRYMLGLGHSFVKYPSSVQRAETLVKARSMDGLSVRVKLSFHFRVKAANPANFGGNDADRAASLGNLYKMFHHNERDAYQDMTRDVIQTEISQRPATEFFQRRWSIGEGIQQRLNASLWEVETEVISVQVANLDLREFASAFLDEIQATENERQGIEAAEYNMSMTRISKLTQVQSTRLTLATSKVRIENEGRSYYEKKAEEAKAFNATLTARLEGLQFLRSNISLDAGQTGLNTTQLLAVRHMLNFKGSNLRSMFNVPMPTVLRGT